MQVVEKKRKYIDSLKTCWLAKSISAMRNLLAILARRDLGSRFGNAWAVDEAVSSLRCMTYRFAIRHPRKFVKFQIAYQYRHSRWCFRNRTRMHT